MCTAISYSANSHYFGRNLDVEFSFDESVVISPRRFPLIFRNSQRQEEHFAMIGMAHMEEKYPLYYDATNEKGLSVAALSFPGEAVYHPIFFKRSSSIAFSPTLNAAALNSMVSFFTTIGFPTAETAAASRNSAFSSILMMPKSNASQ